MNVKNARRLALSLLLACCAAPAFAADTVTLEPATDRMGSDYNGFALDAADPQQCRQACAADTKCKAYTYVKPGVQGPQAMCFLKSAAAPATASDCCTSGVRKIVLTKTPATTPVGTPVLSTVPMSIDPNGERDKKIIAQGKQIAAQQAQLAAQKDAIDELSSLVGAARDQMQEQQATLAKLQATVQANQATFAAHKHSVAKVRTLDGTKKFCGIAAMAGVDKPIVKECSEAAQPGHALHYFGFYGDGIETDVPYQTK
jgi:uncharacterized coiled-coil protein SlyX